MDPNSQPRRYSDRRQFNKYSTVGQGQGGGKGHDSQRGWLYNKFEGQHYQGGYSNRPEQGYQTRNNYYEGNYTQSNYTNGQGYSNGHGHGYSHNHGHSHGGRSNSKGAKIRLRVNGRLHEIEKHSDLNKEKAIEGLREFIASLEIDNELDRMALLIRLLHEIRNQGLKLLNKTAYETLLMEHVRLVIDSPR